MGTRKQFSPEFKREAVQLLESGSRPASELARELGIARTRLYKWQTEVRARDRGISGGRSPEGTYHGDRPPETGVGATFWEWGRILQSYGSVWGSDVPRFALEQWRGC